MKLNYGLLPESGALLAFGFRLFFGFGA